MCILYAHCTAISCDTWAVAHIVTTMLYVEMQLLSTYSTDNNLSSRKKNFVYKFKKCIYILNQRSYISQKYTRLLPRVHSTFVQACTLNPFIKCTIYILFIWSFICSKITTKKTQILNSFQIGNLLN